MAMTVRPLCFASPLARIGAQRPDRLSQKEQNSSVHRRPVSCPKAQIIGARLPDRFSKKEWISSVRPAKTLSIVKSSETLDTREVASWEYLFLLGPWKRANIILFIQSWRLVVGGEPPWLRRLLRTPILRLLTRIRERLADRPRHRS